MRRLIGGVATLLAAVAFSGLVAAPSAATGSVVLADCAAAAGQTQVVLAGSSVTLAGPTWMAKNRGLIQDFLHHATVTLRIGDGPSTDATAGFSAPSQLTTTEFGLVWATTWQVAVPAPALGAPALAQFDLTLTNTIPDLLTPPTARPVQLDAGLHLGLSCTLLSGQRVDPAVGGTVRTADGAVALSVPPAAVATETTITIAPATVTPPAAIGSPASPAYTFGPEGTQFATPTVLSIAATNTTDAHIASLSNGAWLLRPSTANGGTVTAEVRHFSTYLVTATPGMHVIGGRVTASADGLPLSDVDVQVYDASQRCCALVTSTATDANGEYALLVPDGTTNKVRFHVRPGVLLVNRWAGGADFHGAATYTATADQTIDTNLASGYPITGHVTDATNGNPVGGAIVAVASFTPTCCGAVSDDWSATDGSYWVAVPAGTYKLQVGGPQSPGPAYFAQWWANANNANTARTVTLPGTTGTATADIALQPGVRVSGTVTDGTVGVQNVVVLGVKGSLPNCCPGSFGARTDAAGRFSLVVAPGPTRFRFIPPTSTGLAQQWYDGMGSYPTATTLSLAIGDTPTLSATLTPGFTLSGHVTDPTGAGVQTSVVAQIAPTSSRCCDFAFATTSGADGAYTLIVPQGTYLLYVQAPFGSSLLGRWYHDQPNSGLATQLATSTLTSPYIADQVLPVGLRVSGTVTDGAGLGIGGVYVNANDAATAATLCCPNPVGGNTTDAYGRYAFLVPAGTYRIFFNAQGTSHPSRWYSAGAVGGVDNITAASDVIVGPSQPTIDMQLP